MRTSKADQDKKMREKIQSASQDAILAILKEIEYKAKKEGCTDRFDRQFVIQAANLVAEGKQVGRPARKKDEDNGVGLDDPSTVADYMSMDDAELDAAMQERQ